MIRVEANVEDSSFNPDTLFAVSTLLMIHCSRAGSFRTWIRKLIATAIQTLSSFQLTGPSQEYTITIVTALAKVSPFKMQHLVCLKSSTPSYCSSDSCFSLEIIIC